MNGPGKDKAPNFLLSRTVQQLISGELVGDPTRKERKQATKMTYGKKSGKKLMKYLFQYFFNLPEVRGSASIFG
jgi:hypothetical protein